MSNNYSEIKQPFLFSPETLPFIFENLTSIGFNIPIYQRLYAWSEKEILALLNDFANSYRETLKSKEPKEYFIGNLTLNYNEISNCYDIIDGQQRITTLWLIGLVLNVKRTTVNWKNFLMDNDKPTLKFTARESDNLFLNELILLNKYEKTTNKTDESIKELIDRNLTVNLNQMMVSAIICIDKFFKQEKFTTDYVNDFSKYIFSSVKMAAVYLPASVDLNKYFEDMNNRGLQLEAHHILKAKFLVKVGNDLPIKSRVELQNKYAEVWDAVSQMNQYVEYGFKGTLNDNRKNIIEDFNLSYLKIEENKNKDSNEFFKDGHGPSLESLITNAITTDYKLKEAPKDIHKEKILSIIDFPNFLLLCLSLYIYNLPKLKNHSFDDKKLIKTFDTADIYDEAQDFIKFILKARIIFDNYFIKSIATNDGTKWEILTINKNETDSEYERKKHCEGEIVQLQSMLNVSFSINSWLVDAMRYCLGCYLNEEHFRVELINIERKIKPPLINDCILNNGTQTNRYWFYKLDFLLWKMWTSEKGINPEMAEIPNLKDKIRNFQFRENRSVEHIQPQNPQFEMENWNVEKESLKSITDFKNQFGNLAVISIRSNSSYNNQLPSAKKDDFIKRTKNSGIESLKLLHIYSYSDWSILNMEMHQIEMIKLLKANS